MRQLVVSLAVGFVAVSTCLYGGEFLVIDPNDTLGGTFHGEGYTRTYGYQFTVGPSPLSSLAFGVRDWDGDGLDNPHQVGLWDIDGNLLATTTTSPGTSTDGFRYVALNTPVLLDAGHAFVLGATYVDLDSDKIGISLTWENGIPVYNPAVTFNLVRFGDSLSGLMFPDNSGFPDVELGVFGPNAEFVIVPEPSAIVILGSALAILIFGRQTLQSKLRPKPPKACKPSIRTSFNKTTAK